MRALLLARGSSCSFVSRSDDGSTAGPGRSGASGGETADNTGFTWTVPVAGTYIIQIKYSVKSISGTTAPVPDNITYTFTTNGDPSTSGSIPLIKG